MLIGRKEEIRKLKNAFTSRESEFVAVYGRRRVGKTYLVREVFNYSFTFQHAGISKKPLKVQLNRFRASLVKQGYDDCPKFADWYGAFDALEELINRSQSKKKIIFLDELWTLIGASSSRLAADYVLEIFKVIRGYGGAAFAATQDIGDFFSLDDGKYGKGVINNSRIKFILQLEEDEAFAVQKYMSLSDEETMQIIRNQRGEALLCANRNRVCINIKASPILYDILTTKRSDLEKRKKYEKG